MTSQEAPTGTGLGRLVLLTLLAFLGGAVGVYLTTVVATLIYWEAAGIGDRDGGGAMGLIFGIGPAAGLLGGILSAIVVGFRLQKADAARPPTKRMSRRARLALAVVPGALIGYVIGAAAVWILIGPVTETLFLAIVAAWTPIVLALVAGGLAYLLVRGREPGAA